MRLDTAISLLNNFFSQWKNSSKVRWIESQPLKTLLNVHLIDADLDVSKALADFLFSKFPTIVLCSATLATNQQFGFIRQRLGLHPKLIPNRVVTEHIYDSPFDYRKQALLAVPTDMPPPTHADFNEIAYENVWKAIEVSRGHAFVLFTSYKMLQHCYDVLVNRLETHRYPVFKQGDDNRQGLLNKFKNTKRAVLFGTDSFWEGVDVVGDALRCVIIVKLPFKVPSEPIIQARAEAIMERGGDPFFEFSVPHAIVKFKQGFGRLIRHRRDRGCIICLDTRLVMKGYGKLFINSLPPCEKAFMNGECLWPKIEDFYRQTYHLVKQS
jgi:ATP-dependent DNA helicase DinG